MKKKNWLIGGICFTVAATILLLIPEIYTGNLYHIFGYGLLMGGILWLINGCLEVE